ncbi:helix-turn-helix transcriptional regulator [Variovorax sp. H27-G14]|uniref:helix-turn-helix domain-containing protein n=1 Tax=Variovorax sp. H27-G14 TaxID=3111914 RepID=UPI0038FC7939
MSPRASRAPKSIFGARLREARERLALPQDRLGVMIGLDESSSSARMSRYETGIHEPPIATARQLALALDVPLAYLYCDDDVLAQIVLKVSAMSGEARRELLLSL